MKVESKIYWDNEGLSKYFLTQDVDDRKMFSNVATKVAAIPADIDDLVRIHKLIRSRMCFTVLEFGVGYSSLIIADALSKNERDWNKLKPKPEIRNGNMFRCFSVDTSAEWISRTKLRFPLHLTKYVHFHQSKVEIGTHNGQICHFYTGLPDIVPDFIYLDGPDPKAVEGKIRGMSFQCKERTVMSGDLLLMEPILLPGTFILIDGRTNNARFLQRNFTRNFNIEWDREGDVTTMELDEERLGRYNLLGTDFIKISG